eukprot:403345178
MNDIEQEPISQKTQVDLKISIPLNIEPQKKKVARKLQTKKKRKRKGDSENDYGSNSGFSDIDFGLLEKVEYKRQKTTHQEPDGSFQSQSKDQQVSQDNSTFVNSGVQIIIGTELQHQQHSELFTEASIQPNEVQSKKKVASKQATKKATAQKSHFQSKKLAKSNKPKRIRLNVLKKQAKDAICQFQDEQDQLFLTSGDETDSILNLDLSHKDCQDQESESQKHGQISNKFQQSKVQEINHQNQEVTFEAQTQNHQINTLNEQYDRLKQEFNQCPNLVEELAKDSPVRYIDIPMDVDILTTISQDTQQKKKRRRRVKVPQIFHTEFECNSKINSN